MKKRPEKVTNVDRDRAIAILHERISSLEHIFDAMVKYIRAYIDWKGDLIDFSEQQKEQYSEKGNLVKKEQKTGSEMDRT